MISAIRDNNPVVILESRWIYNIKQDVSTEVFSIPLDKAHIVKEGKDITVVAYGDGLISSLQAYDMVKEKYPDLSIELIDVVSINPIDYETIAKSVQKTGRLLTVDTTNSPFSIGSEIIAKMATHPDITFQEKPIYLSTPNVPCPTSPVLTEFYYPTRIDIVNALLKFFKKPLIEERLSFEELNLAPTHTLS